MLKTLIENVHSDLLYIKNIIIMDFDRDEKITSRNVLATPTFRKWLIDISDINKNTLKMNIGPFIYRFI